METVGRAYETMAELYIDLFADVAHLQSNDLALIVRHLCGREGVVLDAGCGPGHLTAHLRSLGVDAIGIDIVPSFIDHARSADADGAYALGSIDRLPSRDRSVTGILAWYSLIHFHPDDLDRALVELRRVAVPGTPLVTGIFEGAEVDAFDHKVATAYRWPADEFAARLHRAGFAEIERVRRSGIDQAGARPHAVIAATAI